MAPQARINDYAGVLAAAERDRLERRAAAEERKSGNQVVVAIFPALAGDNLEDFSIRLAQQWKIGQRGRNNGVILLAFLVDRKLRIEVGYGLEARLTDATTDAIIRNEIAPRFREQRYADGIDAGLGAIFKAIDGEYRVPRAPPGPRGGLSDQILVGVFVLIFAIAVVGLLGNLSRRNLARGRHGYTTGPGGWYFGGGCGIGSGGGGFSGGGGGFGGGGSSGSW